MKPLLICCTTHGTFSQTPSDHLFSKAGCPKCARERLSINKTKSTQQFVKEALLVHGHKYDYSQTEYKKSNEHVIILCPNHGSFQVTPSNHISHQSGCPRCFSSKGEKDIRRILRKYNIMFEEQKTFRDCINPKTGHKLRYDFFIPSKNILIEYDGPQHYQPTPIKGLQRIREAFDEIQARDKIKNQYAHQKHITLIRVPYYTTNVKDFLMQCKALEEELI